ASIASEVTLVHRSQTFRAAPDSVAKAQALAAEGTIRMITDGQVSSVHGAYHGADHDANQLAGVTITLNDGTTEELAVDHYVPLFGLSPKLGPIAGWGLGIEKNAVSVDPTTYMTSVEGVYAVGDIAEYPNKLKLILSGFHEAALALHVEYQRQHPEKKHVLKYTTVTGISGM
ncbi:MAG: NAD(P)/FAD-dependent oxidoreductase, partial [Candidatus Kapaibacteriota bacterium]